MILKDIREVFAPLMRDPAYRQELLITGAEEEGSAGIITVLREIALALEINTAQKIETGTSEAERKGAAQVRACGGAASFTTVCAALDALGLDLVLVRRQDTAQTADDTGERQAETQAEAAQAIAA